MNTKNRCKMQTHVDAHFSGRIKPKNENILRQHLKDCQSCRKYYNRHLIVSDLDPKALDAQTRLAIGLGFQPRKKSPSNIISYSASLTAVIALLIVFIPGVFSTSENGFSKRGTTQTDPRILVFHLNQEKPPTLVESGIQASDELAFAYENPSGKKWLMVFGVDEHRNIYWYHPAWQDSSENPISVPILQTIGIKELPEAISHDIRGKALQIYGLFSDREMTVREIEELIKNNADSIHKLKLPSSIQTVLTLTVRH